MKYRIRLGVCLGVFALVCAACSAESRKFETADPDAGGGASQHNDSSSGGSPSNSGGESSSAGCNTEEDCDDGDPCTVDTCDEEAKGGCSHALVDNDNDGYAPEDLGECAEPSQSGDCDDNNTNTHPGAPEQCNEIDDDCDGAKDEDSQILSCLPDEDKDGFGTTDGKLEQCSCPEGYVLPRDAGDDCDDTNPDVKPIVAGEPAWARLSTKPFCAGGGETASGNHPNFSCSTGTLSWDWDCNGSVEKQFPKSRSSVSCSVAEDNPQLYCPGCESAWLGSVPECGDEGTRTFCTSSCGVDKCSSDVARCR